MMTSFRKRVERCKTLTARSIARALAVLAVALVGIAACWAGSADEPVLTAKQWGEDLQFFAKELPKRHINAFHFTTREKFEAAVATFDRSLDHTDFDHFFAGLRQIAAMIGDGHTNIGLPNAMEPIQFPLVIAQFGDAYRVTRVAPGLEKALGARVIKIQDTPVERAAALLFSLAAQDEFPWYGQLIATIYMANPRMLHGLDIITTNDKARYTLAGDSGQPFDIEVYATTDADYKKIQWISPSQEVPLSAQKPDENFYFIYLPESRTVYCNVRVIRNLGGSGKSLMNYLKQHEQEIDKLVIDLRQNGGGDYFEGLHHLVEPIRDNAQINREGHLFVLIGARTFSAAMSNATHFRYRTKAMLVGTAIGEKPNSYAEGRSMTLPNSHLVAGYSVKFYTFVENGENAVGPDKEIRETWEEYAAGKDAALEWILKYTGK